MWAQGGLIMASKYIGHKVQKVDAYGKVTGEALYSADYYFDDMLIIKALRAPHPHCIINKIDITAALKVAGVVKIITASDIPEVKNFGLIFKDQEVLIKEKARYLGDALALVAAENNEAANLALKKIEVDYKPLPIVNDPFQARDLNTVSIHTPRTLTCDHPYNPANVLCVHSLDKGNVEQGFAQAEHIFETEIATSHVEHLALQPEAGVCVYDPDLDFYTLYAATQWLHDTQADVAQSLGIKPEQLKIIQPAIGGAFGKREDISVHIFLVLMAKITGRPVKMVFSREESMIAQSKRHPITYRYKTGVDKEGLITAMEVEVIGDTGAYASSGSAVLAQALYLSTGPYNVENLRGKSYACYTNNTYCGAMRGFGGAQACFAYETNMDIIAEKLGLDSVSFRMKNLYELGSTTPNGQVLTTSVGVKETFRQALKAFQELTDPPPDKKRGWGIATSMFSCGYGEGFPDHSICGLKINEQGEIEVFSAASDVGQGVLTIIAQIVAEVLQVPLHLIKLKTADTHNTKNAGSTSATRQTIFSGNAARIAAEELLGKIYHRASMELGRHHPEITIKDGQVYLMGLQRGLSLAKLAEVAKRKGAPLESEGCYFPQTDKPHPLTAQGEKVYLAYTFNTNIAVVDVDITTGQVEVKKVIAVPDVGKAINVAGVEGQSEGGIVMGLGMALMEQQLFQDGKTLNPDLSTYIIPTSLDMPEMETIIVESGDAAGPYGAKGIGEPAMLAIAPAITNAVFNACGVRVTKLPLQPEFILKELGRL